MISPFAFFFYAAFNPFLLALNQSSSTRWLTAFFLPHMVVPPNEVLTVIRISGSVFFVIGMLIFLVCAVQVYLGKLLKWGVAAKGLYAVIRHPQYLGLGLAGLGLAIMWPRFLTLMLLAVMLFLYYLLAKDEERRMINRFGDNYIAYMKRTGMFLPYSIEKPFARDGRGKGPWHRESLRHFAGSSCCHRRRRIHFRAYTVHHLPMEQVENVDAIAITQEDLMAAEICSRPSLRILSLLQSSIQCKMAAAIVSLPISSRSIM